jgi:hypothetical protein
VTLSLLTLALVPEGYQVTSFLVAFPTRLQPAAQDVVSVTLDVETIATMLPPPDVIVHEAHHPQHQLAAQQFLTQVQHDPVVRTIPLIVGSRPLDHASVVARAALEAGGQVRVLRAPLDADAVLRVLPHLLARPTTSRR